MAEGEKVEFNVAVENAKPKAVDVTGPGGSTVQGAPFRQKQQNQPGGGGYPQRQQRRPNNSNGDWRGNVGNYDNSGF